MDNFVTRILSMQPDAFAPDGSEVRLLASGARGSMAHFRLPPGGVSKAVAHKTVEEIWYFIAGCGWLWRKLCDLEETVRVKAGVSITIPVGTHFQFRSEDGAPLEAIGVTMPPWPGEHEAFDIVGIWPPNP
jgi:mannose-6-phosphate isomerase-like protein (cupin superfamily)